jgi:hypothetical protein
VETVKRIKKIAARIAASLKITGPFNIQFLGKDNDIKVIECNLRASRSFPFVSKTFNLNFIEIATKVMVHAPVKAGQIDLADTDYVCMKVPMFSFTRLQGADPVLRVEMASTGEVACFGRTSHESFLLGLISTGFKLPKQNILVSAGPLESKLEFLPAARALVAMGFTLYGTKGSAEFYAAQGLPIIMLTKPDGGDDRVVPNTAPSSTTMTLAQSIASSDGKDAVIPLIPKQGGDVITVLRSKVIDLVINMPHSLDAAELTSGYHIRRTAVDFGVPLLCNMKNALLLIDALERLRAGHFAFGIKSWQEYMRDSKML